MAIECSTFNGDGNAANVEKCAVFFLCSHPKVAKAASEP
jgi:hypothetical protein